RNARVLLLDFEDRSKCVVLAGHPDVEGATISRDGQWVATGTWWGQPNVVRVANVRTGKVMWQWPAANPAPSFSPDSKWLATVGDACRLWEVGTWRLHRVIPQEPALGVAQAMAFSLDGKILAVSHSSRIVRLLEHATGQELARLAAPHAVEIVGLYFSAD